MNVLDHARNGWVEIDDTSAYSNLNCFGFLVMSEAVISAITLSPDYLAKCIGSLANFTKIPEGLYVPVEFTAITLTSGEILALNL